MAVVEIEASDTWALRRMVLRKGDPNANVAFAEDALGDAFHLGVRCDGALVAVATFFRRSTPHRPDARATQLRGMAVNPDRQGRGVGRLLLTVAIERIRANGSNVLWANARDSALDFYQAVGMTVVGEGFFTADTGLPHHVVVIDL